MVIIKKRRSGYGNVSPGVGGLRAGYQAYNGYNGQYSRFIPGYGNLDIGNQDMTRRQFLQSQMGLQYDYNYDYSDYGGAAGVRQPGIQGVQQGFQAGMQGVQGYQGRLGAGGYQGGGLQGWGGGGGGYGGYGGAGLRQQGYG